MKSAKERYVYPMNGAKSDRLLAVPESELRVPRAYGKASTRIFQKKDRIGHTRREYRRWRALSAEAGSNAA